MEPDKTYQHLEELAEKLGISIRYEDLSGYEFTTRSGLCRIKGELIFIMDASKDLKQRIRSLSECLGKMDLDGIYVVPNIRKLLESAISEARD